MSLLSTNNISKSFGENDILLDLSVSIPQKARIGLVGPNGVGKTTLLEILAGIQSPTSGSVVRSKDLRTGYLPQVTRFISEKTLWDECNSIFATLQHLEEELKTLENEMKNKNSVQSLLAKYSTLQDSFENQGGYTYETRIKQTLSGLGFKRSDFNRPINQLSGGQRTRVLLAKVLMSDPNLMFLDEPTNHLDVPAIEWLETYLQDWNGALVIVSHDRYLLDQVVRTIWELTPELEIYKGNYSHYVYQREERYAQRLAAYESQSRFIEKEEEYIRRNIAGQNTRQAQGRRKRLERMLEESRLFRPSLSTKMNLRLETTHRSGDQIIRTHELKIGYLDNDRALFSVPDLILERGKCVALIGPNGAGKTTFLKTLLGIIPPFAGEVDIGASLNIGYFDQAHANLKPECSVFDSIEQVAPQMLPAEMRDFLAKYQFFGDDVFKKVQVLSGGERGRLALAILSLQKANLLLLDEPTSHLDITSQEILENILEAYSGTIILVSHDRYLIDSLASQIWEISPEETRMQVFLGTFLEYRSKYKPEIIEQDNSSKRRIPVPLDQNLKPTLSKRELQKRKERIEHIELEISSIEEAMEKIAINMEALGNNFEMVSSLGQEYITLQDKRESLYEEWESLSEIQ